MSSVYFETNDDVLYVHTADKAVDGIYVYPGDELYSVAHTQQEDNPWWRVDLERVHCVRAVNILNKGDRK